MKWNEAEIDFNDGILTVLSNKLNEMIITNNYEKYNINSKLRKNEVTHITFKNKTQLPENTSDMFSDFKYLKTLDLTNVDFKNVKSLTGFITNCPSLEYIYIGNLEISHIETLSKVILKSEDIKYISIDSFKSKSIIKITEPFLGAHQKIELNIKETHLPNLSLLKYTLRHFTDGTLKKLNRLNAPNLKIIWDENLNTDENITLDLSNFKKLSIIILNSGLQTKHLNPIIFPVLKTEFEYIETKNMTGYETIKNNIQNLNISVSVRDETTINIPNDIQIYKFRYSDGFQNVKINNKNHIKQMIKENKPYFQVIPLYKNVSDKNIYIKALEDIIKEGYRADIQKYIDQDGIPEKQKQKFNLLIKLKGTPY